MRHAKHRHQLRRKMEHRTALMANLAMALIKNRRIRTTLAKAKALRPFVEKTITLAKKAYATDDKVKKHHYHKLALARLRNIESVNRLFDVLAEEFINRPGGYTRIYKLVPRLGDAADIAIIGEGEITAAEIGDSIFFACGKTSEVEKITALARDKIGQMLNLIDDNEFAFCWIVDYPICLLYTSPSPRDRG